MVNLHFFHIYPCPDLVVILALLGNGASSIFLCEISTDLHNQRNCIFNLFLLVFAMVTKCLQLGGYVIICYRLNIISIQLVKMYLFQTRG